MTWPLSLRVDDTILRVAPSDFDADSPLKFLEFQWVRSRSGAEGMRVLYSGPDRRVNYAWPRDFDAPTLTVPLGTGVGLNAPADFTRSTYTTGADGVHIDVDFTDAEGHRLTCRLDQSRPWRGFDFLAPPAAGMEHPNAFFFPYLRGFNLVPQPLNYHATFDGRPLHLAKLPFLWHGRRALTQKACSAIITVELLPDGAPPLAPDTCGLELDAHGALERWVTQTPLGDVVLTFEPPLPPAERLSAPHAGRWSLVVDGDFIASGPVETTPDADGATASWRIDRSWQGTRQAGPAWLLTRAFGFLRRWPKHFSWSGRLNLGDQPSLDGHWINAKPMR